MPSPKPRSYARSNVKSIPTKTLKEIQSNWYRTKDGTVDYEESVVDEELIKRDQRATEREHERLIKEREYYENNGRF